MEADRSSIKSVFISCSGKWVGLLSETFYNNAPGSPARMSHRDRVEDLHLSLFFSPTKMIRSKQLLQCSSGVRSSVCAQWRLLLLVQPPSNLPFPILDVHFVFQQRRRDD
jgi:hypothetical protein